MASFDGFDALPSGAASKIAPFQLHVSDSDLADLKTLLQLSKVGPETWENSTASRDQGEYYGITRDWLATAKDTWLNSFDWRANEAHINSFPNFKTEAQEDQITYSLHFAALFSRSKDAVPVIFMHGWPGSFCEFLPMLDLLRTKYTSETLPFHAIVPSLPGFGLSSGPPVDRDFDIKVAGRLLNQLMVDLGFGSGYVAQGGDLGHSIALNMATDFDECKAVHVNLLSPPSGVDRTNMEGLEPHELASVKKTQQWTMTGAAYAQVHATRPGTIGLVLSSSPLALLAWLGEKYTEWADTPLSLDTILRLTTLYWLTSTIPRCIYPYRALLRPGSHDGFSSTKPMGYSVFNDIITVPKAWCKLYPNMKFRQEHSQGGHFAALEEPQVFLQDIEAFLKVVGPLE